MLFCLFSDKHQSGLKGYIHKEIERFSSDKTGKTDFALEATGTTDRKIYKTRHFFIIFYVSTGGKIVQLSPGTENFEQAVTFFGMTLCDGKHGPRAMIQVRTSDISAIYVIVIRRPPVI